MSLLYPTFRGSGSRMPGITPSAASIAAVAAAHLAVLFLLSTIVPAERFVELAKPLTVRLIEQASEAPPPPAPPPKVQPPRPKPSPARILAVETPAPPSAEAPLFTVPTPPAPIAAPPMPAIDAAPPAPPAPAPPAPMVQARFDADYLQNPKPVYPPASRRLGEEGKVVLRVHVSAEGWPTEIELKASSGYPRLDAAARAAVEQWRFVPARRGDEAIAAWVLVPIVFSLGD